jgi:hypothetical protein
MTYILSMSDENQRQPVMGLTFEKVWAMFQESDRRFKETEQSMKEAMKETDRIVKETNRIVGNLGNKFGKLAEYLVVPNMLEKFKALDYTFTKAGRNIEFREQNGAFLTEVDVLLENGDFVMIVEVKSDLTVSDVKDHVERMEKLRRYADDHGDARKLLGAVAGAIMTRQVKTYAFTTGFYVIEQSGDTVKIEAPGDFKPRIW